MIDQWDIDAAKLCKSAPAAIDGDRRKAARALTLKLFACWLGNLTGGLEEGNRLEMANIKVLNAVQKHWSGKLDSDAIFDCIEAVRPKAIEQAKERGREERWRAGALEREAAARFRADAAEEEAVREARAKNSEAIKTLAERLGVQRRRAYQIADEGTTDPKQAAVAAKVFGCKPSAFLKHAKRRGRQLDVRTIVGAYMRGYRDGCSWRDFVLSNDAPDGHLVGIFDAGYRRNDPDMPDHFDDFYMLAKFARKHGVENTKKLTDLWAAYRVWRIDILHGAVLEDIEADAYDFG